MSRAEVYERMSRETGSSILARLYRERAAQYKEREDGRDNGDCEPMEHQGERD